MKIFLFSLLVISFPLFAGTEINNGGGGITVNGNVATFYSATVKVYSTPANSFYLLDVLKTSIQKLKISNAAKLELLQNISDEYGRQYYTVDENSLSKETLAKIKADYHKVTNIPLENLTVFAVTDSESKITLLLPDFYKLTPAEKNSILLHESLWINGRVKNYEQMLNIDKFSQIYFENPGSCSALYNFVLKLEEIFESAYWANAVGTNCEIKQYQDLLKVEMIPLKDIFNSATREQMAKIILSSYFNLPYETTTLIDLLSKDPSKIFKVSRAGLINELKKGSVLKARMTKPVLGILNINDPLNESNIKRLSSLLKQELFEVSQSPEYFFFNLPVIGTINIIRE